MILILNLILQRVKQFLKGSLHGLSFYTCVYFLPLVHVLHVNLWEAARMWVEYVHFKKHLCSLVKAELFLSLK